MEVIELLLDEAKQEEGIRLFNALSFDQRCRTLLAMRRDGTGHLKAAARNSKAFDDAISQTIHEDRVFYQNFLHFLEDNSIASTISKLSGETAASLSRSGVLEPGSKLEFEQDDDSGLVDLSTDPSTITLNGETVEVAYKPLARLAVWEYLKTGSSTRLATVWSEGFLKKFLGASVERQLFLQGDLGQDGYITRSTGIDINRDSLWVSPDVNFRIDGGRTLSDSSRLVKIILHSQGLAAIPVFQYAENMPALFGRDEIGQLWLHFVPPTFIDRTIDECDRWICWARKGEAVVTK